MKIEKIIFTLLISLIVFSCSPKAVVKTNSPSQTPNQDSIIAESLVNLDDIMISPKTGDAKIVEVYRTDIQEKCERKYLESAKAYRDGDLKVSRLNFDDLLEHLEYFYGDEKLSDSLMLTNFIEEFDTSKLDGEEKDIFRIYSALYSEETGDEPETEFQIQENRAETPQKALDSKLIELLKADLKSILSSRGVKSVEDSFTKDIVDAFNEYTSDRIKTREIILRSAKYESFVKPTLKSEGLDPLFFYIPAVMTTYYNEKNNGGIWGLDNTRSWRKIRNDVGASTALIVKMLKEKTKSTSTIQVISEIVKERNYSFKNDFSKDQIFNSDFAGFLAIAIILENPNRFGFKDLADVAAKEDEFVDSYQSFTKNPVTYIAEKQKEKNEPIKNNKGKDKKEKKAKEQLKIKYTVQKGDNLQKIAAIFKVEANDIAEQNPKSVKKQKLQAGSVLIIKTTAIQSYQAKSGDNMSKLCQKFGMSVADFMDLNNLDEKSVYKGRRYYVYK